MNFKNKIKKIFIIVIILLMIVFLKNVIGAHYEINLYLALLIIFGFYIMKKHKQKILKHKIIVKRILIMLIVFGVLIRIGLLFLDFQSVKNEFANFYWNSVKISYHSSININNVSMFPYGKYYILILGNIMKLFGTSYKTVIGVNILFDYISIFGLYLYFKKNNSNRNSLIASTLWAINPINIIWCTKCIPIVIFNTCLIYSLLLFTELKNNNELKKIVLPSIIIGLFIGVSSLFNSIIIVLFISIFLFYLYLFIYKKRKIILLFTSIILILIPFKLVSNGMEKFIEKSIKTENNHNLSGWNLYVGSDIKCGGSMCYNLSLELKEKIQDEEMNTKKINRIFKDEGIKNYLSNNSLKQNIKLFRIKFRKLTRTIGYGSVDNLNLTYKQTSKIPFYKYFIKILRMICDSYIMVAIISVILSSYYLLKNRIKLNNLVIYLLIVGFILYNLAFDANPIYMIPILVPFTIIIVEYLYNEFNYIDVKRN